MHFLFTAIVRTDTRFQFSRTEQPIWFRDGAFTMDPFGFNRIQPRTFRRQPPRDNPDPLPGVLHTSVVLPQPDSDGLTLVPRGVVPDHHQGGDALRRQLGTAPGQKVDRYRTDRTAIDKTQQHLFWGQRLMPYQQPITGQGLGIGIGLGSLQLLQPQQAGPIGPTVLVGLGQTTPPDFIAPAQRPRRMGLGQADQPVASFFFRT